MGLPSCNDNIDLILGLFFFKLSIKILVLGVFFSSWFERRYITEQTEDAEANSEY